MVTRVKPEARTEYEAVQKEISAAYKKAGVPFRAVLQTVFGDLQEYVSVTPISKFAEMDDTGPLERALGAEGALKLRRRGAAMTTEMRRMASLAMPDLSIRTPADKPMPYAMVTHLRLAAGRIADWTNYMRNDYLPVMKKGQVPNFWVSQTVFGVDGPHRVVVRPLAKLGQIDDGPIVQKILGAEGARNLQAKAAGLVASTEIVIVRYREDLSYESRPPATK
jgi:hypothetical protein